MQQPNSTHFTLGQLPKSTKKQIIACEQPNYVEFLFLTIHLYSLELKFPFKYISNLFLIIYDLKTL